MSRKIANGILKQPIKRKTRGCDRRVRQQVAVGTVMPEEASKRATANTIQKRRPVRTRAVVKKNASAAVTVTIDEITPDFSINPEMELSGIAGQAELEAVPDASSTASRGGALTWEAILIWLAAASSWVRKFVGSRKSRKRLRVCETVSLGDKRFVAVIEIDGEQFLVGGASNSVATLARLDRSTEFSEELSQRWAQDPVQA